MNSLLCTLFFCQLRCCRGRAWGVRSFVAVGMGVGFLLLYLFVGGGGMAGAAGDRRLVRSSAVRGEVMEGMAHAVLVSML